MKSIKSHVKWDLILDYLARISDHEKDANKQSDSAEESMGEEDHPDFAQRKAANLKNLKNIQELRDKAQAMVRDYENITSFIRIEGELVCIGALVVPRD